MNSRLFRWLLAIASWIVCALSFRNVLLHGDGFGATPALLFGFAGLIAGVLLVSPEIVRPVCDFFADAFLGFIYPGARAAKPPLSYLLARRYRDQRRFGEALTEYQKILHYYPKEKTAWHEMLLLALEAGDERTFHKYARRYLRRFREPFDANHMLPPHGPNP